MGHTCFPTGDRYAPARSTMGWVKVPLELRPHYRAARRLRGPNHYLCPNSVLAAGPRHYSSPNPKCAEHLGQLTLRLFHWRLIHHRHILSTNLVPSHPWRLRNPIRNR